MFVGRSWRLSIVRDVVVVVLDNRGRVWVVPEAWVLDSRA
jgi:hypothetical protein